jgi:hypothetical protein
MWGPCTGMTGALQCGIGMGPRYPTTQGRKTYYGWSQVGTTPTIDLMPRVGDPTVWCTGYLENTPSLLEPLPPTRGPHPPYPP